MKTIILNSIAILIAFGSFAQRKKVELIVSPDEVSVGQTVSITIRTNMEGELVENLPSNFIKGYGVNTSSSYVQDLNTGEISQEFIMVINGAFSKAGTYKIGPFYMKDGNKSKRSNIVSVKVVNGSIISTDDFSKEQLKKPAFGIIERSAEKVYEGQALVLNARVYSQFSPSGQPLLKRNYEVKGIVESHELGQFSKNYIETVSLKGKSYSTFSYDKRVIFPTTVGKLDVSPFNIMLPYGNNGYDLQSNVPSIEVLPLPNGAPKDFIGGVGKFEVTQKIESKKLKQGDVFTLELIISGEGNLHNLDKPKLPLPAGMVVYGDPTLTEDFTFGSRGAQGSISYTYNIQVTKEGAQKVPAIGISYFDPELEKYVTVVADSALTIDVKGDPKFTAPDAQEITTQNQEVSLDQLAPIALFKESRKNSLFGTFTFWTSVSLPIALAFCFILFTRFKESNSEVKEVVVKARTTRQQAKELFAEAKTSIGDSQSEAFYAHIEKGMKLLCVVAGKLDPALNYARMELMNALQQQSVNKDQLNTIEEIFTECDNARYGISGNKDEQASLLQKAEYLLDHLSE